MVKLLRLLSMKVVVTDVSEFIVTVQAVDVPEHPPDHPVKVERGSGVAVKVTTVPGLKLIPVGLVVIVPVPVPALATVRV